MCLSTNCDSFRYYSRMARYRIFLKCYAWFIQSPSSSIILSPPIKFTQTILTKCSLSNVSEKREILFLSNCNSLSAINQHDLTHISILRMAWPPTCQIINESSIYLMFMLFVCLSIYTLVENIKFGAFLNVHWESLKLLSLGKYLHILVTKF